MMANLYVRTLLFLCLWVKVYGEAITSVRRLRKWNNPPALEWYTFMNNSLQQIELVGPSTGWFAFGIGNSTMDNTYAIVISEDGELSEHILGDHNAGFEYNLSLSISFLLSTVYTLSFFL